ncbi:hypothetical protein RI367_007591 [Sorochytrium milnesiophthora]
MQTDRSKVPVSAVSSTASSQHRPSVVATAPATQDSGKTRSQALTPGIAKMHHIAAQAICCAIEFTGYNAGVAFGWPSFLIAFLLATVLFWMLGLSIAEMSCSLPFAGGPATFAQAAFGHGTISALSAFTFTVAYCSGVAWALTSVAGYVATICNFASDTSSLMPMLWLVLLQLVVLSNYRTQLYFQIAAVIAVLTCSITLIYILCSLGHVGSIQTTFFASSTPTTFTSVLQALPYGIFFYWGVETLPLTAEECHNITTSAPKATIASLSTLTVFSAFLVWLNCGLMPSLDDLINSDQAMLDSFFFQVNVPLTSSAAIYVSAIALAIQNAGWLHANLYAAARHAYSLSRAGYLPIQLSYTHQGSPVAATLACAAVAYAFAIIFFAVLGNSGVNINTILLSVTTWLLCVSYASELVVFIRLRYRVKSLPRPWRSPVGVSGAAAGVFVACLSIFGPFAYDPVTTGWIFLSYFVFMAAFMLYFYFYAKTRLRNSPEKQFINAQLERLYHLKMGEVGIQTQTRRPSSVPTATNPTAKTPVAKHNGEV